MMIDSLRSIKNQVRALRAYSLSPHRASIKINQNENPFDAPPAIKEETLRRLEKTKVVALSGFHSSQFARASGRFFVVAEERSYCRQRVE